MSNEAPTDALGLVLDDYVLVPREPTGAMLKAAFAAMNATPSGTWKRMKAEARHPIQIFNAKMRPRWSAMLSAAPASPLPGGGDWINGLPDVPVGSPAWCAWATHEIMNLRAKLPAAPTGEPK